MKRSFVILVFCITLVLGINCGDSASEQTTQPAEQTTGYPPTAKVAIHEQFLQDLAAVRDPSDGGGSVRLVLGEGEDGSIQAGGYGRWEFEFTAGPLGIAQGGSLFFMVAPFWGWSAPHADARMGPGFTAVTATDAELEFVVRTADRSLLQIEVTGRALREGDKLSIVYGANDALARADDYAEDNSMFYFKVDGDGDGLSGLLDSRPAVRVTAGPAARMTVNLTSTARPGGEAFMTVAVLDRMASAGCEIEGQLKLESIPQGLELPENVQLQKNQAGKLRLGLRAGKVGTYRIRTTLIAGDLEFSAISNPIRVGETLTPVFWADLHGHSNYSDGTGTPRQFYEYARDVSALDVVVLTDHDHFGVRFMDATPEIWDEIKEEFQRINDPGNFVALLGYEWTSWLYGHRHVVYFNGHGEVLSSVGANTTTPSELWDALRGKSALTFAHHSAGGPVGTDWTYVPDETIEPVTEIMSVHGSSEALDSPARIYSPLRGNFVRDQLDRGLTFGFIGSGDSHDGHPGHAHLSPNAGWRSTPPDPRGRRASVRMGNGGLAAIRAERLEESSLLKALRARNTYATSGPRIWLDAQVDGHPMGSRLKRETLEDRPSLRFAAAGTSEIEYVEIIRSRHETKRLSFERLLDIEFSLELPDLQPGDYVYVRLIQNDGALAWSSPFFIEL
ncbi:MAG: hypothetical protein ACI8X5_000239 [Planctomycetota bacterium]|jgi:hypothetical protein